MPIMSLHTSVVILPLWGQGRLDRAYIQMAQLALNSKLLLQSFESTIVIHPVPSLAKDATVHWHHVRWSSTYTDDNAHASASIDRTRLS